MKRILTVLILSGFTVGYLSANPPVQYQCTAYDETLIGDACYIALEKIPDGACEAIGGRLADVYSADQTKYCVTPAVAL